MDSVPKVKGLTDQQVLDVILKVAANHKNKKFSHYDSNDIQQVACVIALSKLPDFDPSRRKVKDLEKALEHWLNTVISNRLANFVRDKYHAPQKKLKSDKTEYQQQKRINLMHPLPIDDVSEGCIAITDLDIDDQEILSLIIAEMDDLTFDIFDSVMSGEVVNSYYRQKLFSAISDILKSLGYSNG